LQAFEESKSATKHKKHLGYCCQQHSHKSDYKNAVMFPVI